MIKNIIFDVGRVLVQWDPQLVFSSLGYDDETAQAVADATIHTPQWSEFDRSALSDEQILDDMVANAPEYEVQIREFFAHANEAIYGFSYAKEWIQTLKEAGYHVYILSNYSRHMYARTTEALYPTTLADGHIFSFEVQQVKPEPEIYQTLLQKYDLVPQECVFIDDLAANISAAREQGINGIQFTSYEQALEELRGFGVEI